MHRSFLRIAITLGAAIAAPVLGQSVVVPNANATVTGNDTSGPLVGLAAVRFQTVLDPDQFPPGPINITGFAYRPKPGTGALNVSFSGKIYLSTSPNWANSTGHPLLSTTFANNVGPDNTLVRSLVDYPLTSAGCAAPGPCPFADDIVFSTPFPYNRANGPLLIDGQITTISGSGGEFDVISCLNTSCVINGVNGPLGAPTGTINPDPRFGGDNVTRITYTNGTCTQSSTALCLSGGRFRVTADWQSDAASGSGNAVALTLDTGYFWFFDQNNIEIVLKVLNGCGVNNGYWVFAAGLTNVHVVLTVTDTKTGFVRTYINPQGVAFVPVQDTGAFATCP
jgi:hypothetical protein